VRPSSGSRSITERNPAVSPWCHIRAWPSQGSSNQPKPYDTGSPGYRLSPLAGPAGQYVAEPSASVTGVSAGFIQAGESSSFTRKASSHFARSSRFE
jgi:hypothetical protein